METILLVILVIVAVAMIAAVLIQRSEGGALGIGGPGAMFSARGSANFLTRFTAVLAAAFMILSLVLAVLTTRSDNSESVLESVEVFPPLDTTIELKGGELEPSTIETFDTVIDSGSKATEPAAPIDN